MRKLDDQHLGDALATSGLRSTRQRRRVYEVLLEKRDHPTAEEIHQRARRGMPEISFATVYNCLDMLVKCDLVKQVNLDREPTRYCPNMQEHVHFHCDECGGVLDVPVHQKPERLLSLPDGCRVKRMQLTLHGICHACGNKKRRN